MKTDEKITAAERMAIAHRIARDTLSKEPTAWQEIAIRDLKIGTLVKEIRLKIERRRILRRPPRTLTIARRKELMVQKVINSLPLQYRKSASSWAGGEHYVSVDLSDGTLIPTASGSSEKVWSKNNKWTGTNSYLRFRVSEKWLSKIYVKGRAVYGGMLVLDIGEAFALVAKQGRGFSVSVENIPIKKFEKYFTRDDREKGATS